jgi:general secretion pathway protein I
MTTTRDSQAGFTLIEALIAMAVLALGAMSLLSAAEENTKRISDVTDRTSARWLADYRLTALRLGIPSELDEMMGLRFKIENRMQETSDSNLIQITVGAALVGENQALFVLDGYASAQVLP